LNTGNSSPDWYEVWAKVSKVVFDASFAEARPTTTYGWFDQMRYLTSITGLSYLNTSEVTNMGGMFRGCYGLTSLDLSHFNTEKVTDMEEMFWICTKLRRIYVGSEWSTASVTKSAEMFGGCVRLLGEKGTAFNPFYTDAAYAHLDGGAENPGYLSTVGTPIPIDAYAILNQADSTLTFYYDDELDSRSGIFYSLSTGGDSPNWYSDRERVSKVVFDPSFADARPTSTRGWFNGMENLTSITGLSYLNTSEVTDMTTMFFHCIKLKSLDLSHFNTEKVTSMQSMFSECDGLTSLDISSFNTENVTHMASMFYHCIKLTSLDVSHFNTENVTNMSGMFSECIGLTSIDVSNFNTAKVRDMGAMFSYCESLTSLDVTHFNTENVTDMWGMFSGCDLTSLDVSNFNTAKVTNMSCMFMGCNMIILDVSNFNTAKVTDMKYMFEFCSNLRRIYVGSGWDTTSVSESSDMFKNCKRLVGEKGTTYDANHTDVAYAHLDGGAGNPGYLSTVGTPLPPEAYAVFTEADCTLTFYYDNQYTSRQGILYDLNTGRNDPDWYKDRNNSKVSIVVFDPSFADARPTSTYSWFYGMEDLTSITGISYLNTSEVTNMDRMFYRCIKLTSLDLSRFNTENVTNMFDMFGNCTGLTSLDVSHFNTEKVTDMSYMFHNCSGLTSLDLSSFNTENVTTMKQMFYGCYGLTSLDVSNFNTEKVTNMSYMFYGCYGLTSLDVSNFNTENVTDMGYMFYYCKSLTSLDLSNFNTENVTDMSYMFGKCNSLERIYVVSRWSTANVTLSTDMFKDCTKLVGQQRTAYDDSYVDASYARLDEGTSNPGYLSVKWFSFEKDGIYYGYGWDNEAGQNGPGSNHVFVVARDALLGSYSDDVVVPATVTYNGRTYDVAAIMDECFKDCSGLTSVTLPETSIGIEMEAFAGCTALQTIICNSTTPPYLTRNTFTDDHYQSVIVIVPAGTKATYQAADYWKNFVNIFEPVEPNEPIDYAGTIWQEYTTANGELYEANETGKTLTIAPSAETPGIVNLGYPAFKMAGSNEKLNGFNVNGVIKYKDSDGTIYYTLTEPKRMQIRSRTASLLCNVMLVGVQSSLVSMPALKLTLTGVRTQFEDVIWFGYGPDLERIKALFENVDDIITGVSPIEETGEEAEAVYTIGGMKLNGKPTKPGLYIVNGKKVLR
jgi:surface protein